MKDQGFTSAAEVAQIVARKVIGEWTPTSIVDAFVSTTFPKGITAGRLVTDGMDNIQKANRMHGKSSLFVIASDADEMMPIEFSERLLFARYGGGHGSGGGGGGGGGGGIDCNDADEDYSTAALWRAVCAVVQPPPASSTRREESKKQKKGPERERRRAVLRGGHGTFFGEQPEQAEIYYKHLVEIGLISDRAMLRSVLEEAKEQQRSDRSCMYHRHGPSA
jgi:hypothetical protein